jgi:hypothetical protein
MLHNEAYPCRKCARVTSDVQLRPRRPRGSSTIPSIDDAIGDEDGKDQAWLAAVVPQLSRQQYSVLSDERCPCHYRNVGYDAKLAGGKYAHEKGHDQSSPSRLTTTSLIGRREGIEPESRQESMNLGKHQKHLVYTYTVT